MFFLSWNVNAQEMILKFNTNLSSGTTVTLPLDGSVNVTVDWGDGDNEAFTTTGEKNHTYASEGNYTVTISGTLTQFGSTGCDNIEKLTSVDDFGDIGLTDLTNAFKGAVNLTSVPNVLPSTVTNTRYMFRNATSFNDDIGGWDVTNITNMSSMFLNAEAFNQNIGSWTVDNVTDMSAMFRSAEAFNQNIGSWNVGNVTDMTAMFRDAEAFNQNIGSWTVDAVTDMGDMFRSATVFNQNIDSWNVGNVDDMRSMFRDTENFNQDLNSWDVAKVTEMDNMFNNADVFNGNIADWTTSIVTDMNGMFTRAEAFNQNINGWDMSSVTNTSDMFYHADNFNQNLDNWNVSNVTNMEAMFRSAALFNGDITNWNVANVTNMEDMFWSAEAFNQDIGGWTVTNVTDMSGMFRDADVFNQDISGWNVSNVTDMYGMFSRAYLFDQNIGIWTVTAVTNMQQMFLDAVVFNHDISSWNVSNVTNMQGMFMGATLFNQDISSWDVSNVTNMKTMFTNTAIFNQDISSWDVTSVTDMNRMFDDAVNFDQNLGGWDVSNVTDFSDMFQNITLSTENYDNLLIGWSQLSLQSDESFNGGNSIYSCQAEAARNILTDAPNNWIITDVGLAPDATNPIITSTHNDIEVDAEDNCEVTLASYTNTVTATDNCDNDLDITQTPAEGTTISGSLNEVTLTVTDDTGNYTETSFYIDVVDNTSPEITSTHNDQTIDADESCEATLPNYTGDILATDNCDADLDITQTPAEGTTISGSLNEVTLTVTDDAGNTNNVTFNIEVEDNTNPEITCVENQTINLEEGENSYTVQGEEFDPTTDDNCGVASVENNYNSTETLNSEIFTPGIYTITWTVTDDNSNSNECEFILTVNEYVGINNFDKIDILIYPNPTNGIFTIENAVGYEVTITDISGKIIYVQKIDETNCKFVLQNQSGVYFIQFKNNETVETIKIIKK